MKSEYERTIEKDKKVISECFILLGRHNQAKVVLEENKFNILKGYAKLAYHLASYKKNHVVMDKITKQELY